MLTPKERRSLKVKAFNLKPFVTVGRKGLTDSLLEEIDTSLATHELVKIKISSDDRQIREFTARKICLKLFCELVQRIGNVSTMYRARVE